VGEGVRPGGGGVWCGGSFVWRDSFERVFAARVLLVGWFSLQDHAANFCFWEAAEAGKFLVPDSGSACIFDS
jgi:hypothetical protein